ncbi:hypothetical protein [Thiolapillus sp.]|uniref:hypothetical protein n=1 Tax=Thiolapillus sp. TaxID=2017437 RepID=UPI003AF8230F
MATELVFEQQKRTKKVRRRWWVPLFCAEKDVEVRVAFKVSLFISWLYFGMYFAD